MLKGGHVPCGCQLCLNLQMQLQINKIDLTLLGDLRLHSSHRLTDGDQNLAHCPVEVVLFQLQED